MRLLDRYLLRQLVSPFVFSLAALTSIMILNQVARRFGALVGKGLPWSVIAEVFGLSIPFIVAITLPMAVLMAVLYTFTHLAADNEVTAMRASGISVFQIVAPVFSAGVVVAIFSFAFTDQVLPRSNAQLRNLMLNIGRKKPTFELREQVINELGPAGIFLRALRIDANTGKMRDVTIYDMAASGGRRVVYADSGIMALTPDETDLSLRLFSGSVHQFKATDPQLFQLTYFQVNDIRVKDITNQFEANFVEAQRGDREMSTCEMLGVIRSHEADIRQADIERSFLLLSDLRALLGRPVPSPPSHAGPRPAGGYCRLFEQTKSLFTPKTAEAQEPAQRKRPLPGRGQDTTARGRSRPSPVIRPGAVTRPIPAELRRMKLRQDSLRRLGTVAPEDGTEPAIPDIQMTNWAEVANASTRAKDAREFADRFEIEVHKKWSISAACVVFVLVGIPMALRFPRGGMGLVLGGGLAVFSVYYIGLIAGEALGDRAIVNPVTAMWASNGIFVVIGLIGLLRVSRESGSTRGGDFSELFDALLGRWRRWRAR
ncbi:MAG: LptF/LptG family permease [Gemmatimonadota bacterium]